MTGSSKRLWKMDLQKNKKNVALKDLMPLINEKLNTGGTVRLPATGMSMSPLFRHMRDEVTLESVDGRKLEKYDMILYRRDSGEYVLHRIVGYAEGGLILRGDAQYIDEYPVRQDQVIACVIQYKRKGREHACNEKRYRLYTVLWVNSLPARRVCCAAKRWMGRLYYRIFTSGKS